MRFIFSSFRRGPHVQDILIKNVNKSGHRMSFLSLVAHSKKSLVSQSFVWQTHVSCLIYLFTKCTSFEKYVINKASKSFYLRKASMKVFSTIDYNLLIMNVNLLHLLFNNKFSIFATFMAMEFDLSRCCSKLFMD
jgi:hypothetical protein